MRHAAAGGLATLAAAPNEWLSDDEFRGCAFLNSVSELGQTLPDVVAMTHQHKASMTATIEALLPASPRRASLARAAAMAVDGAIVQTQFEITPEAALTRLAELLQALESEYKRHTLT